MFVARGRAGAFQDEELMVELGKLIMRISLTNPLMGMVDTAVKERKLGSTAQSRI